MVHSWMLVSAMEECLNRIPVSSSEPQRDQSTVLLTSVLNGLVQRQRLKVFLTLLDT